MKTFFEKKNKLVFSLVFVLFCIFPVKVYSQEALKSLEEEYFDFLSLTGTVLRPTLNYRTLSDSVWIFDDETENFSHPWMENNLGKTRTLWTSTASSSNWFTKGIKKDGSLRFYGPESFTSFNSDIPYGQNDGALWQGKGFNTSLSFGLRFEALGFEATVKPKLSFSENSDFPLTKSNYSGEQYKNRAEEYGYFGVNFIDAPQRFGDEPFWNFDFGDTEIRWSFYTFTVGFGTQSPWLGPALLNPIIHSNNAPSYPKLDLGFRKTNITLPYLNWNLGDFELRAWWGKLTESDYYDNNEDNDENLISGLSVSWAPPYLTGLTLGFNRTMLSKWNNIEPYTLFDIYVPWMQSKAGHDESDQRASVTLEYEIKKAGFDVYLEWARNDFQTTDGNFLRYPFHTMAYTLGLKKAVRFTDTICGLINLEVTELECSHDYTQTYSWFSTFYAHHKITQGYTNRGQWLASGIGTGGNSQYLSFTLFYPKGKSSFSVQRINPDLDYVWFVLDSKDTYSGRMNTILDFSLRSDYFVTKSLVVGGDFSMLLNLSKNYEYLKKEIDFHAELLVKFIM